MLPKHRCCLSIVLVDFAFMIRGWWLDNNKAFFFVNMISIIKLNNNVLARCDNTCHRLYIKQLELVCRGIVDAAEICIIITDTEYSQ